MSPAIKALRVMLPLVWFLFFAVPTFFVVGWMVASIYEVPLSAESFRFERAWAGLLIPGALLVLIARGWVQGHAAPRLFVSRGRDLARAGGGLRPWIRHSTTGLRATAVGLLALGLMGPQSIHARDTTELSGIDIVLTLDMSLSMEAADVRPTRFEATQAVVDRFIERRPNDRLGAVVFGRQAYTLMPLTTDKTVLRSTIHELQLGNIDGRGTAIGNAVATALNRLRHSEAESKVVILLTDGDSNSGDVMPGQATEFAHTMGVKVFTILMGQSDEAPVQQGVDLFGRPLNALRNYRVNPELLRDMAARTGGSFFQVADRQGLEQSFHAILNTLERSKIEDAGKFYGELFPAFLWPAFALLCLELLLGALVLRRWP